MSDDPDTAALTIKQQIVRLDRMLMKMDKRRSEDMKLRAEEFKLRPEAMKFKRKTITAPLIAGASIVAATAALTTGIIKLFGD